MLGEMYFWGTYNMLGDLETPGDGLIANLGTYYHLDLLVPTAILAAVGIVWTARRGWRILAGRLDRRPAAAVALAVLLVVTPIAGAAAAGPISGPIERNGEVTDYYEATYEPFESSDLDDSVVFIPSPYGPWQNHPFQALRNDPSFDGDTVYALDDRPFDVVDAYPDRDIYRYAYRGQWSPGVGPDIEPHLQSVDHARGDRVTVSATVGVPDSAILVSIRLASGTEQDRYTISDPNPNTTVRVSVADGEATLDGPAVEDPATVEFEDRDLLSTTLFVDYGRGSGFSYEVDIPVVQEDGAVRALTPDLEYCRVPHRCNGNAVYIPEQTPDDVFIQTRLRGEDG
ncbi:hypothetical protein [Halapricum sp. CBA1109]|uniref:DUF7846 domain-containing protein n=1 Tax=Halapricum sp. CBA1109 TaxID=2668068 RepID=UPI00351B20B2